MSPAEVLATLCQLERELHGDSARRNLGRLEQLLHPEFREFGRSGRIYTFHEMVGLLEAEERSPEIHSQEFAVRLLSERAALLTYKSARIAEGGLLERHSLRSSVWQRVGESWQIAFHQGTPTAPFERNVL